MRAGSTDEVTIACHLSLLTVKVMRCATLVEGEASKSQQSCPEQVGRQQCYQPRTVGGAKSSSENEGEDKVCD